MNRSLEKIFWYNGINYSEIRDSQQKSFLDKIINESKKNNNLESILINQEREFKMTDNEFDGYTMIIDTKNIDTQLREEIEKIINVYLSKK